MLHSVVLLVFLPLLFPSISVTQNIVKSVELKNYAPYDVEVSPNLNRLNNLPAV
jgi:hypothetical protein